MNQVSRNLLPPLCAVAALFPCFAPATAADPGSDLDQVVVEGTRAQLRELRTEIVRLEDRFFGRYNELNRIDDFDVHCGREARTGTRLERRSCRAVYEDKALAEEGQRSFEYRLYIQDQLTNGARDPKVMGGPPVQAIVGIEARRPEYRRNLREVVSRNEELIDLLRDRAKLIEKYDALRRRTFGLDARPVEEANDATGAVPTQMTE